MPKVIKKKVKSGKPEQEDLQRLIHRAAPYGKKMLYASLAAALLIISAAGFFIRRPRP